MKLIKSTDNYSCGLVSMAMLLDETPEALALELGHNGGEMFWPNEKEPECFRGFSNQEFIDLCFDRNLALIEIIAEPAIFNHRGQPKKIWEAEKIEQRISNYMAGNAGMIIGVLESGARHAVAWDGQRVFDPIGFIYRFENSTPDYQDTAKEFYPIVLAEFLMLKEIK